MNNGELIFGIFLGVGSVAFWRFVVMVLFEFAFESLRKSIRNSLIDEIVNEISYRTHYIKDEVEGLRQQLQKLKPKEPK